VGQRRRFGDVLEQPIWEVKHQPVHLLAEPFRASPRVPLTSRTSVRQPSDAETGWLYN
jgi:hypothetical protein